MTSRRLLVHMFLTKLSKSMRVASGPDVLEWDLCSQPSTVQLKWHSQSIDQLDGFGGWSVMGVGRLDEYIVYWQKAQTISGQFAGANLILFN